jgi:hypothetical protein
MRVVLDSRSMQARVHVQDGVRLRSLLDGLSKVTVAVSMSSDRLTPGVLAGADVVFVPTRTIEDGNDYSHDELTALERFVMAGGGLLLLSNHGDHPGGNPYDHTRYDRALAELFGVKLEPAWFADAELGTLTTIAADSMVATHPVIAGGSGAGAVTSIVTNNCCGVAAADEAALVTLPQTMIDHRAGLEPDQYQFACALDSTEDRAGRVIVVGDSGFIGTSGTSTPGPGLIDEGDNFVFSQNALLWLGRRLG